jgi:hypothetical protein
MERRVGANKTDPGTVMVYSIATTSTSPPALKSEYTVDLLPKILHPNPNS